MDPIKTLGKILTSEEVARDAIHIAVLPVVAGEELNRGERVKLAYGTADVAIEAGDDYGVNSSIGIIDPFLSEYYVKKGQRCWLFLHPNTVTGMRHHWEHPAVDAVPQVAVMSDAKSRADLWLHQFAERWGFHYDDMIAVATNPNEERDWIIAHGHDLHSAGELGGDLHLFWQNLAVLTGQTFSAFHQERVTWSCSC